MNALVGGQTDFMCADILTGAPQVADGKIKIYALGAPTRHPSLPNVPTTIEAGLPEWQVSGWNGLFAPKGTPKPAVDKLADALDNALDDDATRKRMFVLGCDLPDKPKRGPAPLLALVKSEIDRWGTVIRAAGVKMN
jgi:tripartite-type tricarboxylate transporter receptor subunit TctC